MPPARERPRNKTSGGSDARPWRLKHDAFGFSWPLGVSLRRPLLMSLGLSWISLDSLVRIETFQWVTRLEAGKTFSQPFFPGVEAPQREPAVEAMRKRRIGHGASLTRLLIFCNGLSSEPLPFVAPIQKQLALARRLRVLLNDKLKAIRQTPTVPGFNISAAICAVLPII
jgi:hypothetical protein